MIDQFQLKMRAHRIGGSDAAACCGKDPFKTPYDLWAEKTGRLPAFKGNDATQAGTYFEPGLLNYLQDRLDVPISRDQFFLSADEVRCVNLDGLILSNSEPGIVEAKTTGLFGPSRFAAEWGDDNSGIEGVPERVLIQTHHAFGVLDEHHCGVRLAHVVAFIGGRGFCYYRVPRNDELVVAVALAVVRFKRDFIDTNSPPPGMPSLDVAKYIERVPEKVVEVNDDVVARWAEAREARLAAEKIEEAAKAELLAAMGDAEAGRCSRGLVTYYKTETAGYTVQPSSYRSIRFKAQKAIGNNGHRRKEISHEQTSDITARS